jgi:hypothetical protein
MAAWAGTRSFLPTKSVPVPVLREAVLPPKNGQEMAALLYDLIAPQPLAGTTDVWYGWLRA